jgi:diamine N-acetyltransferase
MPVDQRYQKQGYGRAGMEELIHYMKEKHRCVRIVLGHRPDNERAARLYASLGFLEVDRTEGEIIRELKLSQNMGPFREPSDSFDISLVINLS